MRVRGGLEDIEDEEDEELAVKGVAFHVMRETSAPSLIREEGDDDEALRMASFWSRASNLCVRVSECVRACVCVCVCVCVCI